MLKSMKLQMEQSKRRERMAAIQNTDEVNDEGRTELRSLTSAYEGAEVELRAALLVEGAERESIREPDNVGADFERECRSFDLAAAVGAITENRSLTGREAEVVQELEQRHGVARKGGILIPWQSLIERRADALVDTAPGHGGTLAARPTAAALERFFETSVAGRFGVNTLQVTGNPSFPEIVDGTGLSWVAEGEGTDAGTINTVSKSPQMKTATARYLLTRQAIRQNSGLPETLRRDLAGLLREGIDRVVFQGSGQNNEPAGFETVLTGSREDEFVAHTSATGASLTFSQILEYATELAETAKLSDPSQVRIAGNPIVFRALADNLVTGTAVSGLDRLKSAGFSTLWSRQVSSRTDGESNVYFGAGEGNAFVPMWGAPELIVDPYSESKTGKVALTIFAFCDVLIQRTDTHFFKLSGVQDPA